MARFHFPVSLVVRYDHMTGFHPDAFAIFPFWLPGMEMSPSQPWKLQIKDGEDSTSLRPE